MVYEPLPVMRICSEAADEPFRLLAIQPHQVDAILDPKTPARSLARRPGARGTQSLARRLNDALAPAADPLH